ncbi:MAG: BadF/BadG/BcrA/BcrD ATPase family protein [Patescibacteria group bacterium]
MKQYILAIDGGGSKTKTICADGLGKVLGEGLSGASSLTATSVGAAGFSLRESIRQATENLPTDYQISCLIMGLAGMDTKAEEEVAYRAFTQITSQFRVEKFVLVNDIQIALESGTDKPNAIALIAGTGSNCFARNADGQTAKVGGMDFLLTDQGSGYAIGRRVMREAVKSFDGRTKKSILESLVSDYFQIESVAHLKDKVYNPLISKTRISELAIICFNAAEHGDEVAVQIIKDAIAQLIITVEAAVNKLDLSDRDTDLVLAGSIATKDSVTASLKEQLSQRFMQLNVVVPSQAPVYGALKMALREVKL